MFQALALNTIFIKKKRMKFILTIDTEGDNQWEHGIDVSVKNLRYIPRFQDLCNKYKIKPTYLVTSEVCADGFAKDIFKDYIKSDTAEIGAHLHSWTTPPFVDQPGLRYNDKNHAFASEIPLTLLTEKLKTLTGQIETSFEIRPLSFRSGRYGFNEDVAKVLTNLSYLVDSSVTPYTSWTVHAGLPGGIGGPDFFQNRPLPYKYEFENGSLLEIPITILPTRFPLNFSDKLAEYYFRNVNDSLFLRVFRKFLYSQQPLWLRPHNWMNINLFEELFIEANKIKLPFIVMMFHSSELMAGCSKYRSDEDAIDRLYDLLEQFFILLQKNNVESVTLSNAAINYIK